MAQKKEPGCSCYMRDPFGRLIYHESCTVHVCGDNGKKSVNLSPSPGGITGSDVPTSQFVVKRSIKKLFRRFHKKHRESVPNLEVARELARKSLQTTVTQEFLERMKEECDCSCYADNFGKLIQDDCLVHDLDLDPDKLEKSVTFSPSLGSIKNSDEPTPQFEVKIATQKLLRRTRKSERRAARELKNARSMAREALESSECSESLERMCSDPNCNCQRGGNFESQAHGYQTRSTEDSLQYTAAAGDTRRITERHSSTGLLPSIHTRMGGYESRSSIPARCQSTRLSREESLPPINQNVDQNLIRDLRAVTLHPTSRDFRDQCKSSSISTLPTIRPSRTATPQTLRPSSTELFHTMQRDMECDPSRPSRAVTLHPVLGYIGAKEYHASNRVITESPHTARLSSAEEHHPTRRSSAELDSTTLLANATAHHTARGPGAETYSTTRPSRTKACSTSRPSSAESFHTARQSSVNSPDTARRSSAESLHTNRLSSTEDHRPDRRSSTEDYYPDRRSSSEDHIPDSRSSTEDYHLMRYSSAELLRLTRPSSAKDHHPTRKPSAGLYRKTLLANAMTHHTARGTGAEAYPTTRPSRTAYRSLRSSSSESSRTNSLSSSEDHHPIRPSSAEDHRSTRRSSAELYRTTSLANATAHHTASRSGAETYHETRSSSVESPQTIRRSSDETYRVLRPHDRQSALESSNVAQPSSIETCHPPRSAGEESPDDIPLTEKVL